jgi:hypothetical protein
LAACGGVEAASAEVYVAVDGNDRDSGTKSEPFRTLERARDAIREMKQSDANATGYTVWLRGGVHYRSETFELSAEDSGTEQARVIYRAYDGEHVRISGGKPIPRDGFRPVKEPSVLARLEAPVRSKVLQADLKSLGICDHDPASLGGAELFCNGKRMQVARWPNQAWALALRKEKDGRVYTFTFPDDDAPNAWADLEDVSLHGYWRYDYQDSHTKPQRFDIAGRTITLEKALGDSMSGDRRFYALNVLEELDRSGEWYLDRAKGILYFLPPADFAKGETTLSVLSKPFVAMRNAAYVTVRGLTFEAARSTALVIKGGEGNRVTGCVIRNVAGHAVSLSGGTDNGVEGCDIYDIGSGAVTMSGGDRATLTPARHFVVNCHIHHYARHGMSYEPAVSISGVGNRMAHNLIHDAPHAAVLYEGNDHVIEFNEIHDVVQQTSDAGVLYSGYNWTFRGNVVRHNFFHHIPHMPHGYTRVVYMDDAHCSTTTFGNVFYKTHESVWIGGGRDNVVENNMFIGCEKPVNMDNRGMYWAFLKPDGDIKETGMYEKLTAVPYDKPPWSTRYPKLARILDEHPRAPLGNTLERNVSVRSGWRDPEKACRQSADRNHINIPYMRIRDNYVTNEDPGFVDAAGMNFGLKDDAVVYKKIPGFQRIPFDKIGPYRDTTRASWPVKKVKRN